MMGKFAFGELNVYNHSLTTFMSAEHGIRPTFEERELPAAEMVVSPFEGFKIIDAVRSSNDARLLGIMSRFDAIIANRIPLQDRQSERNPNNDWREQEELHWFQYAEGGHNWLLAVGPARAGLGISEESLSVTQYFASPQNPRQPEAIIGKTVFVHNTDELAGITDVSELPNTSTAVLHFPAIIWGHLHALGVDNPDIYGYAHGRTPIADDSRLLQMKALIDGRSGFVLTGNERDGRPVDVLAHAERIVSLLEDENTHYIESRTMDFDPARG